MDFSLAQLSNENLTILFNSAFYQAEEFTSTDENGAVRSLGTMVHLNDWNHLIYADASDHYVSFETRTRVSDTEMSLMLKICNFFDQFPVHANAFKYGDGCTGVNFIYKHIVPEGTSISDRSLIGVFREFAKAVENHHAYWHQVKEHVA